jgi:hypothetical protein
MYVTTTEIIIKPNANLGPEPLEIEVFNKAFCNQIDGLSLLINTISHYSDQIIDNVCLANPLITVDKILNAKHIVFTPPALTKKINNEIVINHNVTNNSISISKKTTQNHGLHLEIKPPYSIWAIGDLHGDYQTLQAAVRHILTVDQDPIIVFLGDYADRASNPDDNLNTLLFSLNLAFSYRLKGRIIPLRGNHETYQFANSNIEAMNPNLPGISLYNSIEKLFFLESKKRAIRNSLCEIFDSLPNFLVINGWVFCHGAPMIVPVENKPEFDFNSTLWADIAKKAKRGTPNIHRGGVDKLESIIHRVGYYFTGDDVEYLKKFLEVELFSSPYKALIRGHSHCNDAQVPEEIPSVITVNTGLNVPNEEDPRKQSSILHIKNDGRIETLIRYFLI